MTEDRMEEGRYCIYCGFRLSQSSERCPNCGREQTDKEDLFKEYLLKNTKESIRGEIDDALFTVIKNWLLSHLYGIVLLITVIAAAVYVSAGRPSVSVETLDLEERPAAVSSQDAATAPIEDEHELRQLSDEIYVAVNEYQRAMFYWTIEDDPDASWGPGGYPDEIPERPEALHLPAQYGSGRHEYTFIKGPDEIQYSVDRDTMTVNAPTTELGQNILSQGYRVAEIVMHDMTVRTAADGSLYTGLGDYLFVLAEIDGVWYVAEDIIM